MEKAVFTDPNKIIKKILPKLSGKDPLKLRKIEKEIMAYQYFVLVNSLDYNLLILE